MDTPPPPPLPPHHPVSPPPPPPYPSSPPPAAPPPVAYPASPASPYAPPASQVSPTDRMVASLKNVDWKQLVTDSRVFARRFAVGDFAQIQPAPTESAAVAGHNSRMASLVVWRRALLFMAAVLSVIVTIKSCFDVHTFRGALKEQSMETVKKLRTDLSPADQQTLADQQMQENIRQFGENNIVVFDAVMVGQWCTLIASMVFLIFAAISWKDWRKSRKLALFAVLVILLPMLAAMIFPWSALMNFSHLRAAGPAGMEGAGLPVSPATGALIGMQIIMAFYLLGTALPFLYGMFNGILRATLTAKTLVPASIVCGWSTLLLALTIAVPWFCILTLVSQFQLDAIIVLGVICLVAAPLSLIFKSRRLGAALQPAEATPVVKRARLLFTGLNIGGVLMLVAYLLDKKVISGEQLIAPVLQYFAHLMLITVVGVDMLSLLLERAHLKLAADTAPDEALRQLGEVLHPDTPPAMPGMVAVPS